MTGLLNYGGAPFGNALSNFYARPEVKGIYYNGKKVVLDGYTFNGCRFDNCTLEVTSLNFDLIGCVIDPSTVISYGNSVLKVIQLFNSRYPWAYKNFAIPFVPIRNADGSITITDRQV